MIIDKLNADCLFDLIAAKGIDALGSIVQSVLSALRDAKIDELEAQLKIRYNKLRKFQNRRIENSPQNKGQGQRHLVE